MRRPPDPVPVAATAPIRVRPPGGPRPLEDTCPARQLPRRAPVQGTAGPSGGELVRVRFTTLMAQSTEWFDFFLYTTARG